MLLFSQGIIRRLRIVAIAAANKHNSYGHNLPKQNTQISYIILVAHFICGYRLISYVFEIVIEFFPLISLQISNINGELTTNWQR